jgi:hypothetical protein
MNGKKGQGGVPLPVSEIEHVRHVQVAVPSCDDESLFNTVVEHVFQSRLKV